jgi:hypothetical protein
MISKDIIVLATLLYTINISAIAASQMAETYPVTEPASMEQLPSTLDKDAVFQERERTQATIIKEDQEEATPSQKDASSPSDKKRVDENIPSNVLNVI